MDSSSARDAIWEQIRREVVLEAEREKRLISFLHVTVLNHQSLEGVLSFHLSGKLSGTTVSAMSIPEAIKGAMSSDPDIGSAARADLQAVGVRAPACTGHWGALLYFTGFHALQMHLGVLICAAAKVLGDAGIVKGARVAAGSVVLAGVLAQYTVVGVSAEVAGRAGAGPTGPRDKRSSF